MGLYRRSAMTVPVEPVGMVGSGPGLTGGTNVVVDKVGYTAGETVKNKRPIVPHPRLDCTGAALEFNFKWMSTML